jgi:hypothetical protein
VKRNNLSVVNRLLPGAGGRDDATLAGTALGARGFVRDLLARPGRDLNQPEVT